MIQALALSAQPLPPSAWAAPAASALRGAQRQEAGLEELQGQLTPTAPSPRRAGLEEWQEPEEYRAQIAARPATLSRGELRGRYAAPGVSDERMIGQGIINASTMFRLGLGMGAWARQQGAGRIAVVMDTRASGPPLREALIAGLREMRVQPVIVGDRQTNGVAPTPVAQSAAVALQIPAVVITASHNPPDHNGFKGVRKDGGKMPPELDRQIFNPLLAANDLGVAWGQVAGGLNLDLAAIQREPTPAVVHDPGPLEAYRLRVSRGVAQLYEAVNLPARYPSGYPMILDLANGAAQATAPAIVEKIPGLTVHIRNAGPGPINAEVGIERTQKDGHLPLGVDRDEIVRATLGQVDGDADRGGLSRRVPGRTDLPGGLVLLDGDKMASLLVWTLREVLGALGWTIRFPLGVTQTPYSSEAFGRFIRGLGIRPVVVEPGDVYIDQDLDNRLASQVLAIGVGVEPAGHLTLRFRDDVQRAIQQEANTVRAKLQEGQPPTLRQQATLILEALVRLHPHGFGDGLAHILTAIGTQEFVRQRRAAAGTPMDDWGDVDTDTTADGRSLWYRTPHHQYWEVKGLTDPGQITTEGNLGLVITDPPGLQTAIQAASEASGLVAPTYRWVVRASKTAKMVRVYVEGPDAHEVERLGGAIVDVLHTFPGLRPAAAGLEASAEAGPRAAAVEPGLSKEVRASPAYQQLQSLYQDTTGNTSDQFAKEVTRHAEAHGVEPVQVVEGLAAWDPQALHPWLGQQADRRDVMRNNARAHVVAFHGGIAGNKLDEGFKLVEQGVGQSVSIVNVGASYDNGGDTRQWQEFLKQVFNVEVAAEGDYRNALGGPMPSWRRELLGARLGDVKVSDGGYKAAMRELLESRRQWWLGDADAVWIAGQLLGAMRALDAWVKQHPEHPGHLPTHGVAVGNAVAVASKLWLHAYQGNAINAANARLARTLDAAVWVVRDTAAAIPVSNGYADLYGVYARELGVDRVRSWGIDPAAHYYTVELAPEYQQKSGRAKVIVRDANGRAVEFPLPDLAVEEVVAPHLEATGHLVTLMVGEREYGDLAEHQKDERLIFHGMKVSDEDWPALTPEVAEAVRGASLVMLGPGSWGPSVLAHLYTNGLVRLLKERRQADPAFRVVVNFNVSHDYLTLGSTVTQMLEQMELVMRIATGDRALRLSDVVTDVVIAKFEHPQWTSDALKAHAVAAGRPFNDIEGQAVGLPRYLEPVLVSDAELAAMAREFPGVRVIREPLVTIVEEVGSSAGAATVQRGTVHDSAKLADRVYGPMVAAQLNVAWPGLAAAAGLEENGQLVIVTPQAVDQGIFPVLARVTPAQGRVPVLAIVENEAQAEIARAGLESLGWSGDEAASRVVIWPDQGGSLQAVVAAHSGEAVARGGNPIVIWGLDPATLHELGLFLGVPGVEEFVRDVSAAVGLEQYYQ